MESYKRILVAIDLSEDTGQVVARALDLAERDNASVTLVHVIEFVPVEPMGEALLPSVQIEQELEESARKRLRALAQRHGIDESMCEVRIGNIKSEIIGLAEERGCDLIVLGSRERHGLAILLNLTEDTILHGSPCDVLAVRLH